MLALRQNVTHAVIRRLPLGLLEQSRNFSSYSTDLLPTAWVFLGPPGVGKGTYSTRVADAFHMYHISAGDLVRLEMRKGTTLGQQMAETVNEGNLLSDSMILNVIKKKFAEEAAAGNHRFLLDGFPRTAHQAAALDHIANVQLAIDLDLREDILVEKCLGRRICKKCGKNYNVADINLPASEDHPAILMPPLSAPSECEDHLEIRSDDNEETIRKRLNVYKDSAAPVEDYYKQHGIYVDFQITGGIPETLPRLLETLMPYNTASGSYMNAAVKKAVAA